VVKVQWFKRKDSSRNNCSDSSTVRTSRNLWLTLALCCGAVGCTAIKKAGIVATGAAVGATAGIALSGGVIAPIAGAMTTAFVADVVTEISSTTTGHNMDCAPDNIWTIMQSLVEIGGWALLLIFVAPMIIGWILPGPLEKKKKS
jgi:hypothetical protein